MRSRVWRSGAMVVAASLAVIHCGGGGGGSSSPASTPTVSAEGPTALSVTLAQAPEYFGLRWTPPATPFDGYEFEGRSGTGTYTKLHDGLIPNTWTTAYYNAGTSIPELTTCFFRVRVMRGTTPSAYSNEANYRVALFTPSMSEPYPSGSGLSITWLNTSLVADTLLLERGASQGGTTTWTAIPNVPFGTTSWIDKDAPEGVACYYRVTYSKGQDSAQATSSGTATMPMAPPNQIVATPLVEGVHLSWQNMSTVATQVAVMRAPGLDSYPSYQEVAVLPAGTTSYDDTQLATGYYTYRLENRKSGLTSASSSPIQVVTLPPQNGASVTPTMVTLPQSQIVRRGSLGQWFLSGSYANDIRVRVPSGNAWIDHVPTSSLSWSSPYFLLDRKDQPHMVYTRSVVQGSQEVAIMHAWQDGAGWQTEEIARRTLYSSSAMPPLTFALDAQDHLHLLWLKGNGTPQDLEYACKAQNGTWAVEGLTGIPTTPSSLGNYRLAIDPTGQPHVFVGAWQSLFHLTRAGDTWAVETIPSNGASVGWYEFMDGFAPGPDSITFFAPRAHQPYDGSYDLMMFRKEAGSWLPEEVVATTTGYSSFNGWLSASMDGSRFALYYPTSSGNILRVWTSGTWTSTLVGPSSYGNPLLGFDALNKLYLLVPAGWGSTQNSYPYVLYLEQP